MAVGCEQIIFKINFHKLCRISNLLKLLRKFFSEIVRSEQVKPEEINFYI